LASVTVPEAQSNALIEPAGSKKDGADEPAHVIVL